MKQLFLCIIFGSALALGCDDTETTAVVDNGYPTTSDGGFDPAKSITIYRAWWLVTVFTDPIAAGAASDSHRVVSGSDAAYVILAPGWDPNSGEPPTVLIPAKTNGAISVSKGDVLHITVDDAHVAGNCAAGHPLAQADADFITQNIFPGDFAGTTYDAATCTLAMASKDAGAQASDASDAPDD